MGLLGGRAEPSAWDELKKTLYAFRPAKIAKERETKVRDALATYLDDFGVSRKRESGVQGSGTRLDLKVTFHETDFLITIKKGLNEQKVKTVIGEIHHLLGEWRPEDPERTDWIWGGKKGRPTYIVFYFYDLDDHYREYLDVFMKNAVRMEAHHPGFKIEWATPVETRSEG